MNERIRELVEQATTKVEYYPPSCDGYTQYRYDFDKEKFAELIVREVFAKIEDEKFEIYQPVKESVMNHFGVEE